MPWPALTVAVPAALVEAVTEALAEAGAISTSIEDAESSALLDDEGEPGLWPQNRVTALLALGTDAAALMRGVEARLGGSLPYTLSTLADRQWERAWRECCPPLCFGDRLWICPSGSASPAGSALTVYIDPGAAFGTGSHPARRFVWTGSPSIPAPAPR